ncbi:4'-phosphopantetheinyl transferase superfamily protein [Solirubrobacter taibaiensis]|nr:4'-phosphopantetheinyl transferase superfamily protein [Solirubrobacter taibaiensis]
MAVSLWEVALDELPARVDEVMLSPDERMRVARFARRDQARRWTASHVALRAVLGRRLNETPTAVRLEPGRHGKPRLVGRDGPYFSLSHAGSLALIAVVDDREVGVDVEHADRDRSTIARVLSAAEQRLPESERVRIWCRKEALGKAMGIGLGPAPERLDTTSPGDYTLTDLTVGAGYVAALAVAGAEPRVLQRRFTF